MKLKEIWRRIEREFSRVFLNKHTTGHGNSGSGGQSGSSGSSGSSSSSKKLKVVWLYGGMDGSKAKENTSPSGYSLKSASLSGDTLRFSGSGSMWGYEHATPDARNCLFFKEGDAYYGGFFEWGSVDRTSRPIHNIKDRYKGWDYARCMNASEFAFCITNKSGSERSNFVTFKK